MSCDISRPEQLVSCGSPREDRLRQFVQDHLAQAGSAQPRVSFAGRRTCANSLLWEFAVDDAEGPTTVLVKMPRSDHQSSAPQPTAVGPRFRLFEKIDPIVRAQREFTALERIYNHFQSEGDSRFGAIRPLDLDARTGAILMQKLAAPSLKHLLAKRNRFAASWQQPSLQVALENAGAWLRQFHQAIPAEDAEPRHVSRDALTHTVDQLTGYLGKTFGNRVIYQRWAREVSEIVPSVLPFTVESAIGHCDYAPRNVLVDSSWRVTVLDTAACWRIPIYMDLAYFMVSIRAMRAQIYSCGLAFNYNVLTAYEEAFLRGYFGGGPIPWQAVRLYELQALLDRWAAMVERAIASPASQPWARRASGRLQLHAVCRFFQGRVEHVLQGIR